MKLWPWAILAAIWLFLSKKATGSPGFTPEPATGTDQAFVQYLGQIAAGATGWDGLQPFLEAVARRESGFHSSAKNDSASEADAARRMITAERNQKRYASNPYINDVERWSYSGGLYGLMPATALATADRSATTYDPKTIFDPLYATAYATDLVYRLLRSYGPRTWGEVRVGWAAPSLIAKPDSDRYAATIGRFRKDLQKNGVDPSFADEPVPGHGNYPGFQIVLNALLNHAQVS